MSNTTAKNEELKIVREFKAPKTLVFQAFSSAGAFAAWWGPVGMPVTIKHFDFQKGGRLHYKMEGHGQTMWGLINYGNIKSPDLIEFVNSFSDEEGNICKPPFPVELPFEIFYQMTLIENNGITTLTLLGHPMNATPGQEAGYHSIMTSMEEGFNGTFNQLEHYLSTQFKIRKQLKVDNMPRVTTYLNFPGKTEEAFNFYKKVFHGEFTGVGLKRFGDIKMPPEMPPMSDADKKLIIHAELTIMAGHVLMATDSPESMGFNMQFGNNMHINLEPESKEETKRLFDALSEGGNITMPLEDMFWGAYFGSFTDKYGINWMLNFQTAG
ncbi:MAG: hypothetical protein JWM28_1240 [Chitinophagaceae bacterium]|nr:hypothetical protein [Chitinophagaceae bacterium]